MERPLPDCPVAASGASWLLLGSFGFLFARPGSGPRHFGEGRGLGRGRLSPPLLPAPAGPAALAADSCALKSSAAPPPRRGPAAAAPTKPAAPRAVMAAVVIVTASFARSAALASAYGMSVTMTMAIDCLLTSFVATRWCWHHGTAAPVPPIVCLMGSLLVVDGLLITSCCLKFLDGAWFPLAVGVVCFTLTSTWARGSDLLHAAIRCDSPPVRPFVAWLAGEGLGRSPRTALFAVTEIGIVPRSLLSNLRHNRVQVPTPVVRRQPPRTPHPARTNQVRGLLGLTLPCRSRGRPPRFPGPSAPPGSRRETARSGRVRGCARRTAGCCGFCRWPAPRDALTSSAKRQRCLSALWLIVEPGERGVSYPRSGPRDPPASVRGGGWPGIASSRARKTAARAQHECTVMLKVNFLDVPRVPVEEQIETESLAPGFW